MRANRAKMMQAAALAAGLLLGLAGAVRGESTRTFDGGWDTAPVAGDHIVIQSGTLAWDASLPDTVGNWTQNGGTVTFDTRFAGQGAFQLFTIGGNAVLNGGTWTHTANPAGATASRRLNISITGDLTLQSAAQIHADGRGFTAGNGPGNATHYRQGGGYGGMGSAYFDGAVANFILPTSKTYGSVTAPVDLGSGATSGGTGGGAIRLLIGGALELGGGTISANGAGWPGGSGGSVFITAATISGSGTVRANGGSSGSNAGCGGGGRVAVVLTGGDFSGFTAGLMTAYGGDASNSQADGAAGTVYRQTQSQGDGQGTLIVDNQGTRDCAPGVHTLMPSGTAVEAFAAVIVTNRGNLAVGTGATLDFATATIIGAGPANAFITITNAAGVSFPSSFTLAGYTLRADALTAITGDWLIASNGVLSHTDNLTVDRFKLNLTVNGSLTVAAGGAVNVDGLGYDTGYGPGTTSQSRGGGSHGGLGGSYTGNPPTGTNYGSVLAPTLLGSGAQLGGGMQALGGGGAIRLTVTGALTNNGTISANGAGWPSGAGGSVFLTANSLAGGGPIRANGVGGDNAGGGGGGRVSIVLTGSDAYTGAATALGGNASNANMDGAPGTVYRVLPGAAPTLVISNFTGASLVAGVVTDIREATALADAEIRVTSASRVRLQQDTTVGDIQLAHAGSVLDLNGYTLKVRTREHAFTGSVANYGEIIWQRLGTLLTVR